MSDVWQTHTQFIAVVGLIFNLVTSVEASFPFLTISRLTAICVAVYKISIPDAGGSQLFIRLSRRLRHHKNKKEIKENKCLP